MTATIRGAPLGGDLVVYISGHGFGHLAQLAPVLNRLHALAPDCRFIIRCELPEAELRARFSFAFELESGPVDVGVVQHHAISEDRAASISRLRAWTGRFEALVAAELDRIASLAPRLVLSNISPLAFPVARALGVPGIGLATLDWHTIYRHWLPADDEALGVLARAYALCDELLTPPMAMDMPVFGQRRELPLIAAYPQRYPKLADARRKALVLFGGSGSPPYDLAALEALDDWLFVIPGAGQAAPANVHPVRLGPEITAVDLMTAVDVVLCKPGYGVLSECWRTQTPIVWVERPGFPEYPMLERWLEDRFPAVRLSSEAFVTGRWREALEAAIDCRRSFPEPAQDGAGPAARSILARLANQGGGSGMSSDG